MNSSPCLVLPSLTPEQLCLGWVLAGGTGEVDGSEEQHRHPAVGIRVLFQRAPQLLGSTFHCNQSIIYLKPLLLIITEHMDFSH